MAEAADITSFMGKAATNWYSYDFFSATSHVEHHRQVRFDVDPGYGDEDYCIRRAQAQRFLEQAVGAMLRRRQGGMDLKLPLRRYVAANRTRYVNDKLTTLYNALEQVIALVPGEIKGGMLMTKEEFTRFKSAVSRAVAELDIPPSTQEVVINKLRGTTDPGFQGKLRKTLSHFGISIDDIGGSAALRSACDARNAIIHARDEPDIRDMVNGSDVLAAVFERLVVTLLDGSQYLTPPYHGLDAEP